MNQNALAKECDIFGRTCFYNAMENSSKSNNVCKDCLKECDYTTYDGIVVKETGIFKDTVSIITTVFEIEYDFWNCDHRHRILLHKYNVNIFRFCKGIIEICHL